MTHRIYTHKTMLGGVLCQVVQRQDGQTTIHRKDGQVSHCPTEQEHLHICPIESDGRKLLVCDIDGTLLCNLHRAGQLPSDEHGSSEDWMAFVNASLNDPPIVYRIAMLNLLAPHHQLAYVTYRGKSCLDMTRDTLAAVGAPNAPLFMREEDDFRRAPEYKEWQIDRLLMAFHKQPGDLVLIDDDHEICAHIAAQFPGSMVVNVPSHDASYRRRHGGDTFTQLASEQAPPLSLEQANKIVADRLAPLTNHDKGARA